MKCKFWLGFIVLGLLLIGASIAIDLMGVPNIEWIVSGMVVSCMITYLLFGTINVYRKENADSTRIVFAIPFGIGACVALYTLLMYYVDQTGTYGSAAVPIMIWAPFAWIFAHVMLTSQMEDDVCREERVFSMGFLSIPGVIALLVLMAFYPSPMIPLFGLSFWVMYLTYSIVETNGRNKLGPWGRPLIALGLGYLFSASIYLPMYTILAMISVFLLFVASVIMIVCKE